MFTLTSETNQMSMSNYDAVMIAEGVIEPENADDILVAWQHLIDTGLAWTLQGTFGRTAQRLIENGLCFPAT
jgi:hypothetical protein